MTWAIEDTPFDLIGDFLLQAVNESAISSVADLEYSFLKLLKEAGSIEDVD
jgi:hypothetical protein